MDAAADNLITLTTDFGHDSSYAAQMKGVILSRNPAARILDLTHGIPPQDVRTGAIHLADTCFRFPPRTIHVAVVDPGVGTQRRLVFAQIGTQRFLAPDNGLLTLAARMSPRQRVVALSNRTYFLPAVSPTFHGRDILAPVAAHLSLGLNPQRLGEPVERLVTLPIPEPLRGTHGIAGVVLAIDSFGNVISNITAADLDDLAIEGGRLEVRCREAVVQGIQETYGSAVGAVTALVGSNGRLELAVVQGNAAARFGIRRDDPFLVSGPAGKSV